VEAEKVQEVATTIKHAGDPVSAFLCNVSKNSLLGMKSQGLTASATGQE